MNSQIRIQRQNRKSMAMKATPDGLVVLVPDGLDLESAGLQAFIEAGLNRLEQPRTVSPSERLTKGDLQAMVEIWSERIGVPVARLQIRKMRTKWASCSSQGTLTLAADLVRLPRELAEYVICHDLLHLKVPDHGKGFQALMNGYMPDWRNREERLAAWVLANIPWHDKVVW